jgi:hypothetical protein
MALNMGREQPKVKGWGADLSPELRPGIPRETNHENVRSANPAKADRQDPGFHIQITPERPGLTPVFGTSVIAPEYLSRVLRDFAFRYSENTLRHWMILLLADRVHMVEGWASDIGRGKMPMILPRMEFRTVDHLRRISQQGPKNRDDYVLLAGIGLAALGASALLFRYWQGSGRDATELPRDQGEEAPLRKTAA